MQDELHMRLMCMDGEGKKRESAEVGNTEENER
jgi:hypothetical protein